ncbi:acetyltransferase, ribosomal protein N-acetylase [Herbaspirillum sp. CF444]|uniref:GNAT family N-acetyltransferase n=1 Tax=Herbaspirillum sp. CF444 TaxID=1144319 RepID=UPI000272696A|nr:GNAT family protein [Herbaspirillum sp. CF444]EJL80725.1 acetyltransferase, ribosomal protein N-acetylase [Herbaspirillum sp. CF444]
MTTATAHHAYNEFGQPVGLSLADWTPRQLPPPVAMYGRYCRVEPIRVELHAEQLFDANGDDAEGRNFTYLFANPPAGFAEYREWVEKMSVSKDPMMHAIVDLDSDRAVGVASFMRMDQNFGAIEVGNINFSPRLQRTRAATEAMFLMMRRAFDELGYRRYEWKCDSLNAPSRAAALRYGFTFEGIFRKAVVYKNRSRDTAWFSITDSEWPQIKSAFEHWLDPDNFDAQGHQHDSLGTLMARYRAGNSAEKTIA